MSKKAKGKKGDDNALRLVRAPIQLPAVEAPVKQPLFPSAIKPRPQLPVFSLEGIGKQ